MVCTAFNLPGEFEGYKQFDNGHINKTYLVKLKESDTVKKNYIVQAINGYVFKNPAIIMRNIKEVTSHIKNKIIMEGGDTAREIINFLFTDDGKNYYLDENNNFWRVYPFIERSITFEKVENEKMLYNAGYAFGKFQRMLSDFPMEKLEDTIPDFHNTKKRLDYFFNMVEADPENRVKDLKDEIEFFQKRRDIASKLINMQENGELPLRVTHNDTKYNNILMDIDTYEALCVIDLDTVMPGLSVYDFGDAIRFAASTAAEDETDLSKVTINMNYYEAFTKGFIGASKGFFTENEINNMAWGAVIITLELASRFLADHINGDKYFRIHRPNHNLDRARNQMKLVLSMEENFKQMCDIVKKYS
jgi:thiamine kinase-like enzyme